MRELYRDIFACERLLAEFQGFGCKALQPEFVMFAACCSAHMEGILFPCAMV